MNRFLKRIIQSALCILCLSCFFSCHKNNNEEIILDDSNPLALAPDVSWAVVAEPYASYKKEMDWTSESAGHVRRGEILQIEGNATDTNGTKWYLFEGGWLPDSCLSIFNNRLKAENVVKTWEGEK